MSTGADPGPACYGKGGREPTVSDANLVLGRLPEELIGGGMRLDPRPRRAGHRAAGGKSWACPCARRRSGSCASSTPT